MKYLPYILFIVGSLCFVAGSVMLIWEKFNEK